MREAAILILLLATAAWAGPGGMGKPTKLDTPTNVTCTKAGEQITVTWEAVPNALQYRVMLEAADDFEVMDLAMSPPYEINVSDVADDPAVPVTAKVRAMLHSKGGRGASKPSAAVSCEAPAPAQLPAR